ncbi:hypothetical protein PPTG_22685 [Phytophthora nicotianae INRA-310]|uniref:Uncharacterized protein n=1 Tax=Phytophthora nicotianae (strain INRA-310) TaxID=761204 RepID=W2QCV7_PHYN3|nr:hypothetical protein PPTG_22685 [Phytophthora nicotianae INRA-310]ETN10706.1 hypothetical protein PPTG_22685 [Phytophthora nicotianae INRA-310]
MKVLDARVEEVLGNTTAGATKYVYLRALTRFIKWLYETSDEDRRQSLFAISLCDIETINADTIAEWFARPPVCMRYLTSMEQRGVTGKSTFGIAAPPYYYGRSISWCTTKFKDDLPIRPSLVIVSQFLLAG